MTAASGIGSWDSENFVCLPPADSNGAIKEGFDYHQFHFAAIFGPNAAGMIDEEKIVTPAKCNHDAAMTPS